jgi:hypothetical protein
LLQKSLAGRPAAAYADLDEQIEPNRRSKHMRRTPLQLLGDVLGMYAYLAAMGGLQYWPALREASIVEVSLPPTVQPDHGVQAPSRRESDPARAIAPAL